MRINRVKHARKEWKCQKCRIIIKKGDPYIYISPRYGPQVVHCVLHPFRPSEMTSSDKLQQLYQAQESVEDALNEVSASSKDEAKGALETLKSVVDEAADQARDVGEQYAESASNMEQYFTGGSPQIDEITEKSEACEAFAEELDNASGEIDSKISEIEDLPDKYEPEDEPEDDLEDDLEDGVENTDSDAEDWEEDQQSNIDSILQDAQSEVQSALDSLSI